jgi:hypothetical protein
MRKEVSNPPKLICMFKKSSLIKGLSSARWLFSFNIFKELYVIYNDRITLSVVNCSGGKNMLMVIAHESLTCLLVEPLPG